MTTQYTSNFQLAMPDFRQGPWHSLVNGDIAKIDALLFSALSQANVSPWENSESYTPGETVVDEVDASIWMCAVIHVSSSSGTFADERTLHPTYWTRLLTGFAPRGEWTNSTNYFPYDLTFDSTLGIMGLCQTRHESNASGTIKDDELYWAFLIDMSDAALSTAAAVTYSGATSGIPKTNVQEAIDYIEAQAIALNNVNTWQGENIGDVPQSSGHPIKSLQTQLNDLTTPVTGRIPLIEAKNTSQDTSITGLRADIGTKNTTPPNNVDLQTQINTLRTQVAAIPTSVFPAGTKMIFIQAAPPSGWTISGAYNDRAIRIVSGASGGTSGGSVGFTTCFGRTTTDGHALTVAQMPAHSHGYERFEFEMNWYTVGASDLGNMPVNKPQATGGQGGNAAHTHNIDLRVSYVDAHVGVKS